MKQRRRAKQYFIPKTRAVLMDIAQKSFDLLDLLTIPPEEYPLRAHGIEYIRAVRRTRADREFRQQLYALKRREYITMRRVGEKFFCSLTKKGVTEVLRLHCLRSPSCAKGTSILVVFDIPEKERLVRAVFRQLLKECGFTKYQHSVWVCDRNVTVPLSCFIKTAGIEQWVSVFQIMQKPGLVSSVRE